MKKSNKKSSAPVELAVAAAPSPIAIESAPATIAESPAINPPTAAVESAAPEAAVVGIQIESNVPVAQTARGKKVNPKYPVAQLQIGQSFFISCAADSIELARKQSNSVRSAVYHSKKQLGIFIVSRFVEKDPVHNLPGIRFWRVKDKKAEENIG